MGVGPSFWTSVPVLPMQEIIRQQSLGEPDVCIMLPGWLHKDVFGLQRLKIRSKSVSCNLTIKDVADARQSAVEL